MEQKMNWLIKKYNNGSIEYAIQNTHASRGTIVIPTGGGKSGVFDTDAIWHVNHALGKTVINFSAPILKLCRQTINDLVSVFEIVFADKIADGKLMIFVNSSAAGNTYDIHDINVRHFDEIEVFEKSDKLQFAIVISCHDSLYKFAEKIDYLNSFATTINYLDEAHLLVNLKGRRDNHTEKDFTEVERNQVNTLKELCKSDFIYAFTATPDATVTKMINGGENCKEYIIEVSPQELIEQGVILSPNLHVRMINPDSEVNGDICIDFMKKCKEIEHDINHKVLITCEDTDHLERLELDLHKKGYTVFSTCANNGTKSNVSSDEAENDEDVEFKNISEVDFINEVDNYDGDCFVLHIRQLTAGIDVKSLTDCIICNKSTRVNDGIKTRYAQTIGRVLRPLKGERPEELEAVGKTVEDRKKFCGNVLLVIGDADDAILRQTVNFMYSYYGLKSIRAFSFDKDHDYGDTGKNKTAIAGWSNPTEEYTEEYNRLIDKLKGDIYAFMNDEVLPMNQWQIEMGAEIDFDTEVNIIKANFPNIDEETPVSDVLSNYELMTIITETLNKFGIKKHA